MPFYEDQAVIDYMRLRMLRHAVFGAPAPEPPLVPPGRVTFAQLRTAALVDPAAFRGFWNILGTLRLPGEVYTDPHVVTSTHETLRLLRGGPPAVQPTRAQLLAALAR